jgi:chemotaxis protein MotB
MDNQTIIVKRVKKGGHGHHGGAWKVAFADFVTAMMAFFLLLWLLASTTKEEKAGLSEYFSPTISGPTEGSGNSDSVIDLGGTELPSEGQQGEDTRQDANPTEEQIQEALEKEKERLESLMEELKKAIEASQALKPFKDQLLLDITAEGLRIQIVDKENRPMFDSGRAELKSYTKEILHELAKTINTVPNRISLTGHTDAARFVTRDGYTNWELSADRANASRRELIIGGLAQEKIAKVVGLASMVLFNKAEPRSPINRRIAIIVMNKAAEAALLRDGAKVSTGDEARQVLDRAERPKSIMGAIKVNKARARTSAETETTPPAATSQRAELAPAPEDNSTTSPIQPIQPIQLPFDPPQ